MTESHIKFYSECDFELRNTQPIIDWIQITAKQEGKQVVEINFIFCDDEYLHKINLEFLDHDTYTDIITFDYSVGDELISEIYISVDRVKENANDYSDCFDEELQRVLIHGVLHLCGYKDKREEERVIMRKKENYYLSLRA